MHIFDHFAIVMQLTQQVYVAEEWVRNARDKVKAEAHSHFEVEKALGALNEEHAQLSEKLKEANKACLSAEASLKTTERQMEDQPQKFHITEINLATEKQNVLDLKTELQKDKDAARVAREAAEAAVATSYEYGVLDMETRLAEEVDVVCRDYCTKSWGVAMNRAGVLTDSELKRAERIFFPEDIREIPGMIPPSEQLPTTQAPHPDAEISKGVGVGEEAQPPMKANPFEDALTIKDVVFQAKDAEAKSKAGDVHSEVANPKKDPHQAKA